jgi:hypothetical protein
MTLLELQKVLGDRINVTLNKELTTEERETENAQSALIVEVAKQMINNGDLILRTEKLASMNRALEHSVAMQLIYGEKNAKTVE